MARMYEMNLIIRLQDRASARMRRISGDMSALSRHAQAQNRLTKLRLQSSEKELAIKQRFNELNALDNVKAQSYNQHLARRNDLQASHLTKQATANKRLTVDEQARWMNSNKAGRVAMGLSAKQEASMLRLEASNARLNGLAAAEKSERKAINAEIASEIALLNRVNAEIAARAPLEAKGIAAARQYSRGRTAAHAGSLSFMGGAVAVGLSALAASSYAKFDVQAAKAATQVGSTNFSDNVLGIAAATRQAKVATGELETAILSMAKKYPATAESMAAASYNIFSSMDLGDTAARRMANGITILEEANRAAVGGQVDLAVATDTLITVFNDFLPKTNNIQKNVNAVHTQMAQLFSIVRFMRGGFEELSAGMNKLAPAAKQAQQSLIGVGAAFAVVTQAIPSAAQSSTALARLMDLFGSKDFIAGMERAGESVTMLGSRGEQKLIPLYDILQKIVNLDPSLQLGGPKLTNFVKEITQFGSATGKGGSKGLIQMQRALTILITQHIKHHNILRQATQDVSEYDKSVTLLSQTADVKWKTAVNNLRVEWIRFGEAAMPILLKVLKVFQDGLNWFNKLGAGTRDVLGKLIVGFGLLAVAAGLFGSAFGGVMMVVATRRLWAVNKALEAIAVSNGEVTATSGPARAGILGMGKAALRMVGWVTIAIAALEALKSAAEISAGTKGNPAQKFARWWTSQFVAIPKALGVETPVKMFDSLYKKFPAIFGTVVKKTKKDVKELTAAEKELDDLGITKGQKSKLDLIIKTNAASQESEKKLAAYQKSLIKQTIKARQDALKQQKTDIENAAKNLLSKYRELESANKAAMGSLLNGPISGGPILGAYKQVNDMLLGLGAKPIKVPLQFIMQDVEKQVENFDLWRGGLDKIKAKLPKGLSKEIQTGFMDSLKAGGIEKLPEILSLADADPKTLKKYIGYWQTMKKAVDDATKTDFTEQLKLWQSYGGDVAWKIAQGMVDSGAEAALLDAFTTTITTTFAGQLTKSMNDAVAQAVSEWKATTPKPKVTAPASAKDTAWGTSVVNRAAARAKIADYASSAGGKALGLRGAAMAQYYSSLPTAGQQSAAPGFDTNASYTFDKDVPPNAKIKTALGKSWWWNGWRWIPIRHFIKQTKSSVPPNYPGHARGGIIGGRGTGDTVPAMLTPGEVVLNKRQIANASRLLGTANHPQAVFNKVQRFEGGGVAAGYGTAAERRANYNKYVAPTLKKKHHGLMDYLTGSGKVQQAATWTFGKKGLYGAGRDFAQTFSNEGLKAQAAGMYTSFRHPVRRVMSGDMMAYPGGKPTTPLALSRKTWYHGTGLPFDFSKVDLSRSSTHGTVGPGLYLTPHEQIAVTYAKWLKDSGQGRFEPTLKQFKFRPQKVYEFGGPLPKEHVQDILALLKDSSPTIQRGIGLSKTKFSDWDGIKGSTLWNELVRIKSIDINPQRWNQLGGDLPNSVSINSQARRWINELISGAGFDAINYPYQGAGGTKSRTGALAVLSHGLDKLTETSSKLIKDETGTLNISRRNKPRSKTLAFDPTEAYKNILERNTELLDDPKPGELGSYSRDMAATLIKVANPHAVELTRRLRAAGLKDAHVSLNWHKGRKDKYGYVGQGDWDSLMNSTYMKPKEIKQYGETSYSPMFNVEIGKRGKGKYLPGFSVWPREKGYHIDDVMELTDPEFFTNPSIVSKYATALDAIRGTKKSGFVTLYRGMSGKEKSAWNQGQLIPQGKFFTNKPTSQFASDIAGEFPELFKFRVAAKDVVETDPGTFQLLNDAILKGHTISSKSIQKHNKGGWVKGSGNRDNVPAFLTPGEYVVSKPMIRDLTSRKASAAAPITHVTHEQNINVDVTNPTGKAIIDALKPVLFGLRHQP